MKKLILLLILTLGVGVTFAEIYPVFLKKENGKEELVYRISEYPEMYQPVSVRDTTQKESKPTEISVEETIEEDKPTNGWKVFGIVVIVLFIFAICII